MSEPAELTYEETLQALQGFIGKPVSVVYAPAGEPFLLGQYKGTLERGAVDDFWVKVATGEFEAERKVGVPGGEEAIVFSFEEDAHSGFLLFRSRFRGGEWVSRDTIAFDIQGVSVMVSDESE